MPTENNSVKRFKDREHAAELLITKLNNQLKDEIAKDLLTKLNTNLETPEVNVYRFLNF